MIVANGTTIQVIESASPDTADYAACGIHDAIVIDNTGACGRRPLRAPRVAPPLTSRVTGKWRTRDALALHLKAPGARQVVLTAPASGDGPRQTPTSR